MNRSVRYWTTRDWTIAVWFVAVGFALSLILPDWLWGSIGVAAFVWSLWWFSRHPSP